MILDVDLGEIRAYTDKLFAESKKFRSMITSIFEMSGREIVADVKRKLMSGRPGIRRFSGGLKKSLRSRVSISSGGMPSISIYFEGMGAKYAWTHIKGATIVPRRGAMLAINLNRNPVIGASQYDWPKNYPDEFVTVRSGDRLYLRNKATDEVLYRLKSSVHVPSRIPLYKWRAIAEENVENRMKHRIAMLAGAILAKAPVTLSFLRGVRP